MTISSDTAAAAESMGSISQSRSAVRRIVCLVVLFASVAVVPAHGQGGRRCADGKKLTIEAVEGYINRKQDEIAVARIEGCHVGFSLEAPSLQRLVHAGMSEAVSEALNRDTVSQMTAEQAHAEVAGLQENPGDARVKKAFEARIAYLKNAEYTVTGPFTYKGYEQNAQVITAAIGDDEYLFRPVAANAARTLSSNPQGITIVRHFEEDKMRQRVVRLTAEQIELTGNSKQATVHGTVTFRIGEMNGALTKGDSTFERGDYDSAAVNYLAASESAVGADVLNRANTDTADRQELDRQIDAGKKNAADRIAEIGKVRELAKQCKTNGGWCENPADPKALMWELKDNGEDIDAHHAEGYCTGLRTGDYSDWRLPTLLELLGLFDPNVSRDTPPTTKVILLTRGGAVERLPKGTVWQYHIKGGIELTATQVWSSTPDDAGNPNRQALGGFQDGNGYRRKATDKELMRALCVRGAPAVVMTAADPSVISGERIRTQAGQQQPADTWSDPKTRLMWTLQDNGHDVNWNMARDYCQGLRTGGFPDWRLASRNELKSIYDPSGNPEISDWKRHTKGGIALTGAVVWSGTRDNSTIFGEGSVWVKFSDGSEFTAPIAQKNRALCVRPVPATAEIPQAEPAAGSAGSGRTVPAMNATARTPADRLERQGETLYLNHQYDQAFPLAKQSCDQGSQDGCGLAATMYSLGFGVARDIKRAVSLANQSCDAGSARGCAVVASFYYLGLGVPKDLFRAAELFTGSCNAGYSIACFYIGMQTLDGNGVTKDVPRAVQLLHQSCSGGFPNACDELTALRSRGVR
jgi:hypothetical protein